MAQDGATRAVLTVFEVVLLGRLSRLGIKVSEGDLAAASRALDAVGVGHLAEVHIGDLSGGQRQLVQFAQVLAREPRVILLDEPTSALDLRNQLHLLDLVRRETRARGLTTLVTLHDLNAAARFADRLAVLHDGRMRCCGTPEAVLDGDMLAAVWGIHARVTLDEHALPTVTPLGALGGGLAGLGGTVANNAFAS
jgi:iron complex transport system ATP-binding protein